MTKKSDGYFITLEGIEGSGKSTQVSGLTSLLEKRGYDCLVTREPGGSRIAEKIRAILLDSASQGLTPMAELMLYLADRAQHVQEVILPALELGKIVLCDRYSDATLAYQGYARNLGVERVSELNRYASSGLEPDLTLLFDLPVPVGLVRAKERIAELHADQPAEDRFEHETLAFHQRVRDGYLALAQSHTQRFVVIDANQPADQVAMAIREAVIARLPRR